MKRILVLIIFVFAAAFAFAQNFNLNSTSTVTLNCATGGLLFDSGGAGGTYSANQNFAFTICTNGDPLSAEIVSVLMGTGDFLAVFDGTNTITSPLLFVFDENTTLGSGTLLRASAGNPSGCLTFQFSSDAVINGNFEFILSCLPACQNISADVLSSNPVIGLNDPNYIDLCPHDTLTITGTGVYNQNNISYAQSDATSNFYWDFGTLGMDTGQTVILPIAIAKIYSFTLMVEDINGCRSINEIPYIIRKSTEPELSTVVEDATLCLNQSTLMYSQIFNLPIDSFVTGDTLLLESSVSVTDTVFLPDDSDNISGNGITTPVIYNLPISGYQTGTQLMTTSDLIEVCLDIEHSFVGDLDIVLVCPSGQSVALIDFSPPGTPGNDLGIPGVGVAPGTPFTYCWSPSSILGSIAVAQPSLVNTPITAGTYQAVGNWTNLIGCPLNGNWTIQIFDDYGGDDGNTFGASASFNPALLASNDSLIISYNNPLWIPNNNITSPLGNDSIQITLSDTSATEFYFSVQDNLGCIFYDTATIIPDVFRVVASPDSSSICSGVSVQLIAEIEPNDVITCATDYNVYSIPYYKETGTEIPLIFTQADNGVSQILDLPFPFKIFCVNQTQARLTTNGYLQFGTSGISLGNNLTMPVNVLPNNMIALMWDDLIDSLGMSSYFTTGIAPNRKFVVNVDLKHVGGSIATEQVLGQIILHESQNYFDLICENCQNDASDPTATQGAENFSGFFGAVTPGRNNTNWSATNSAFRYYPQSSLSATFTTSWTPAAGLSGANTSSPLATPSTSTTYIVDVTSPNNCTYSDTIEVLVGGSFEHDISPDTTICAINSVQLSVTGGAETIAWTPNDGSISDTAIANPIFSPTTTTTYTATLDSFSCIVLETVTVFVANTVVDSSIIISESCAILGDASIQILTSGTGSPQYSIDGGATFVTTNLFQNLNAGVYDIAVNENGLCDTAYQVTIMGVTPLVLTLDNVGDVICNGDLTGSVDVSTSGGTTPYSYSWTNGGGVNEDLLNAAAGNYTLTVTDSNACTIDITQVITEPTALNVGLVASDVICFGESTGAINANITGGVMPYVYVWTGPNSFTAFTEDIAAVAAGSYTLLTTDSNNCTNTQIIVVNQPGTVLININTVDVTCFGENTGSLTANVQSGGLAPFQFQWDAAANNQVGATATGLIAGTYNLTVTDGNTCSYTSFATITEPFSSFIVSANGTDITCASANDGIALANVQGGTPGYTYLWNDPLGQTTNPAIGLSSSVYQVTVLDANGCSETDTTFINTPNPISVVANPDSANCWGDATGAINVFASGGTGFGYAYSIDGGETFQNSPDFNNLPAGIYNDIIVQDLGSSTLCVSDIYTTTVFEQAYFTFEVMPADTTLQLEEAISLSLNVTAPLYDNSSIVSVSWYPATGLSCSDCIDPSVLTYEHYTEYTATVYYEGGDGELCTGMSNTVIMVENNLQLFIPNAFTPGSFDDVNNVFEVYGEGIEYLTIQVYNRWGEKIFESSNQAAKWDGTFKGEMQQAGVYTYYVNVNYLDGKVIERKGSVTLIR